ncbi:MAG: glycerol acyltransferase [Firmicutes bacterium]|jgi:hypothetical protein|nr:glycerol acyltransferase [Bacillota bacterium]HQD39397.1 glycerol acyltransferase [Bacillota bacterium]
MTDNFIVALFRCVRFFIRCVTHRYRTEENQAKEPAVFVVHHQNLRGPLTSLVWYDKILRPWVLSVFCSFKECFRQYYGYTFTKRFGMPKIIACILAVPAAVIVVGTMKLIRAIPVYRGSREIIQTFKESIKALTSGQSILICPDVDYTDASSQMGEMYSGFLNLERLYRRQTGEHLPFIPIYISQNNRRIYTGQAVCFTTDDFKQEKEEVYHRLQQEFSRLEKKGRKL